MAQYSLAGLLLVAKSQRPTLVKNLNRHKRSEGTHNTDECPYCNAVARDLGLLVSPI